MEFDKNKILTVVTADQAKVGSMGHFSNYIPTLEGYVTIGCKPDKLMRVSLNTIYPFYDGHNYYSLFYPAPEPSYAERQAEWVKENNVKEGTKVRFIKGFDNNEDGSDCCEHEDAKGIEGVVENITSTYVFVAVSAVFGWAVPFTALEVIKEPTYAERQAEWMKENNVKAGTKVRVTRTFTEDEDGSRCFEHDDLVGMTGVVRRYGITSRNLEVDMSDGSVR